MDFLATGRRQGVSVAIQSFIANHWLLFVDRHFWYLSADTSCSLTFDLCSSVICSVFGEDALVNVSVEKKEDNDGKLAGYIRIRSKTQGIALSLGDRITSVQRGAPDKK